MTRINRRVAVVTHDLLMVSLAWLLAYLTRFNFSYQSIDSTNFLYGLPGVLIIQGLALWWTGLYKSVWRFASIPDLWNIIRAATVGALGVSLSLFLFNRLEGVPRATLALYPVFLVFFLGSPRLIYRMWRDHGLSYRGAGTRKRVLLLGAGRAAEMLARDMIRDSEYMPVGFLDDKKSLKGAKVHGLPILGTIDQLADFAAQLSVDVIVIALPSASTAAIQHVVELCEQVNIPFRILPRLNDLMSSGISALREVKIEDLLGREPVSLDWRNISDGIIGKTVLVSGGGGSIGAELCRQIARLGPAALVVFERCEFNLYSIEMELRRDFPNLVLHACLGDVCDGPCVEHAMRVYRPEVIFHAGAYKHVPMLQTQSREAVRNNVLGTKTLAAAADKYSCETFVMISTDKAVNPANVMGATKRVAEIFCQALDHRSTTRFITVRFGNVLGSAGSVVPLFRSQIEAGGPVTVTHPGITRYFMTIPEACQLIMQAGAMGKGGEIFVLDMGAPIKISYLAEQMIRLSGKIPGTDVEIVYTGLRPGEKLYEELFYAQEDLLKTAHDKILLARAREVDWERLSTVIVAMETVCREFDEDRLQVLLKDLVPELQEHSAVANNIRELKRINA